jgi:hypothetical protein
MNARAHDPKAQLLRPMRFGGERRYALAVESAASPEAPARLGRAREEGAVLAYGFVDAEDAGHAFETLGFASLGLAPLVVRPLRLSAAALGLGLPPAARGLLAKVPLVAPFGRARRTGFREIAVKEPRITRLWDRFSIDVGVALERTASYFDGRIFERPDAGHRVFIFEDGDRYAIRAMCIFKVRDEPEGRNGYVMELLHDRSVTGLRAASHLLGLALREMMDAGAGAALAWSLPHSGSYPIYARHAFVAPRSGLRFGTRDLRFGVRAFDPDVEELVALRERWYLSFLDLDSL